MATAHGSTQRKFLTKYCNEFYLDLANWPQVDSTQLRGENEARFNRLCKALKLYYAGLPMTQVSEACALTPARFRKLLRAALTIAEDGRILGYRAFVGTKQFSKRVRIADRKANCKPSGGYSGLFSKIFLDHPDLESALVEEISGRTLNESGKWVKVVGRNELDTRTAHRRFLSLCRQHGITEEEYPFSTKQKARKPFHHWLTNVYRRDHASKWSEVAGNLAAAQAIQYKNGDGQSRPPANPYATWQIDEHKIDAEATYEIQDERGDFIPVKLERCSLILVSEVVFGANLGCKIVYAREPKAEDIVMSLWEILSGEQPRHTLPTDAEGDASFEGYIKGAGFPTEVIPSVRFLCPAIIELDNALSHLSDALQSLVLHTMGSVVRLGKPKTPQERGHIESKFSLLARRLMRNVPGATGSHPRDPVRKKMPPVNKCIRASELEFVIDAYMRNQNALPNAAANYSDALERIRRNSESGKIQLTALPAQKRKPYFFFPPIVVKVKTSQGGRRSPFINFLGRYSSPLLSGSWGLVGRPMLLRLDPRNVQQCWLFHMDGTEFGPVTAEGKWGRFPHSLQIKRLIKHLKNTGALGERAEDAPLDALYAYLQKNSLHSKRDATRLAGIAKYYAERNANDPSAGAITDLQEDVVDAERQASTLVIPSANPPTTAVEQAEMSRDDVPKAFSLAIPSIPRRLVK
jgi:putative transposase